MATTQEAAAFAELSRSGTSAMDAAAAILLSREINLAAWEHEARGKGGKWVRGNPALHPALQAATSVALGPEHDPATTAMQEHHATMRQLAVVHQQALSVAHEAAQTAAKQAVDQALKIHQEAERASAVEEKKKSRKKFLGMSASLVGGAVLGLVEAKLGVNDTAIILSSISPGLAEAAFEWKNRL